MVREPSDGDLVGGHRGLVKNLDSSGWVFFTLCVYRGKYARKEQKISLKRNSVSGVRCVQQQNECQRSHVL